MVRAVAAGTIRGERFHRRRSGPRTGASCGRDGAWGVYRSSVLLDRSLRRRFARQAGPRFRAHCTREAEGASLPPVSQGVFRAGANRQRQQSRRCCFLLSHSITDYRRLSSFQELFQNYRANSDRNNSRPPSRACLRTAAPPRCCTNATGNENRYSADCG